MSYILKTLFNHFVIMNISFFFSNFILYDLLIYYPHGSIVYQIYVSLGSLEDVQTINYQPTSVLLYAYSHGVGALTVLGIMDSSLLTPPSDDADAKTQFRKPSTDATNRKYRRHTPVNGSSSSDGRLFNSIWF